MAILRSRSPLSCPKLFVTRSFKYLKAGSQNNYSSPLILSFSVLFTSTPNKNQKTRCRRFIQRCQLGEREFSRVDIDRASLNDLDLTDINLWRADLRGADLSGAISSYADLSSANLAGANSTHTIFTGANLSQANLSNTNLDTVILKGVNLENTILPKRKMVSCYFSNDRQS